MTEAAISHLHQCDLTLQKINEAGVSQARWTENSTMLSSKILFFSHVFAEAPPPIVLGLRRSDTLDESASLAPVHKVRPLNVRREPDVHVFGLWEEAGGTPKK